MTDNRMALLEMAEKAGETDFLRDLVRHAEPGPRNRGRTEPGPDETFAALAVSAALEVSS